MRLVMMGTGAFAVPTLESLLRSEHQVVALVTRPVPRDRGRAKSPPNPMRDLAEAAGLPVVAPEDVNAEASRAELAALGAELLVVCDYGQILSAATLSVATLGGINLHASLLPKYRGAAPINWALWHGERETGVTVIHITPRLDAGPCLVQESTPIAPDEDAVQLERRLAQLGVAAVEQAVTALSNWDRQTPIGVVQDPRLATKAPRLRKENGAVDWTRTAQQIADQVRALKPWPGTYTTWHRAAGDDVRLILDRVRVLPAAEPAGLPGEIVQVDKHHLVIATGTGLLAVESLQLAGKRCLAVDEFLRGHRLTRGDRFST